MIYAAASHGHHLSMAQSRWVADVFLALIVLALIWVGWRFAKRTFGSASTSRASKPRSYSSWH